MSSSVVMAEFRQKDIPSKLCKCVKTIIAEIKEELISQYEIDKSLDITTRRDDAIVNGILNRFDRLYSKFCLNIPLSTHERNWLYRRLYNRFKNQVLVMLLGYDRQSDESRDNSISAILKFRDLLKILNITYEEYGTRDPDMSLTAKELATIWNDVCDKYKHPESKVDIDEIVEPSNNPFIRLDNFLNEIKK